MGQTLNHGVYLPAEGERNCYSGLASNWNLLDTAIGDIAGKASATHTHGNITNDGKVGTTANKPLITGTGGVVQAGSFGNAANTFCEGNDSRLSDARTPVAHTHTKSDVTDLFNTDNTYSANQNFKNSGWEQGVTPANLTSLYLQFIDKNNSSFGAIGFHQNSDGYTFLNILAGDKYANGAKSTNGSLIRNQFRMGTTSAGVRYQSFDGYWGSSLTPLTNNTYDLGTSTNKWKSLNGINPGALSLPDYNNYLDVTSSIPVASLDGNTQININDYLPNKTGWLSIVIDDTAGNSIIATQGKSGGSTAYNNSRTFHTGAQSNGFISVFFPILADMTKFVNIKASSLIQMRFYYCLGNV